MLTMLRTLSSGTRPFSFAAWSSRMQACDSSSGPLTLLSTVDCRRKTNSSLDPHHLVKVILRLLEQWRPPASIRPVIHQTVNMTISGISGWGEIPLTSLQDIARVSLYSRCHSGHRSGCRYSRSSWGMGPSRQRLLSLPLGGSARRRLDRCLV